MALKHILDTITEPLNHAVGLGRSWRGQAVFDVQDRAEIVELMFAAWCAFCRPKRRSVNSFPLAIVLGPMADLARSVNLVRMRIHCPAGHCNAMSREGAGARQVTQEVARVGGSLAVVNADKDPAGGPVNRHKQIAA